MNEDIKNLQNTFRTQKEKYIYYIIALSVTCIGFSIYQTKDSQLTTPIWVLFSAIICWGTSVIGGFGLLNVSIDQIFGNINYLELMMNPPIASSGIDVIKMIEDTNKKAINSFNKKGMIYYRLQIYGFYLGVLLFICWHIWEMYLRTVNGCQC